MDEPSFSIRKEIEHFQQHADEATENLISRYENPPLEVSGHQQPEVRQRKAPGKPQRGFMPDFLMQMHDHLNSLKKDQDRIKNELGGTSPRSAENKGVSLSVGPEVLRWFIVLLAIIAIVGILVMWNKKNKKKKRKNPTKRRLGKMEKEIKRLRRRNHRRNPLPVKSFTLESLQDSDSNDDDDDDDLDID